MSNETYNTTGNAPLSLDEIAKMAKDKAPDSVSLKKDTPDSADNSQKSSYSGEVFTEDEFDMDAAKTMEQKMKERDMKYSASGTSLSIKPITKEEIDKLLPSVSPASRDKAVSGIMGELEAYKKDLMIKKGFTDEEAEEAARNRGTRQAKAYNDRWVDEHPRSGVITIKKGDEEALGLTKEEHDKLVTTKTIRLNLVESQDLKCIKIQKIPPTVNKLDYVRNLNSIAYYSVPLPMMGDYVSFKGATSAEVIGSGISDSDDEIDSLSKVMTFIYNHYADGHYIKKYDKDGKTIILSYDKFCEMFPFFEVDMALYAIYVASSSGKMTLNLKCDNCNTMYDESVDPAKFLDLSHMSENARTAINDIMVHSEYGDWLNKNAKEATASTTYESPETKNRFTVQVPSAARAQRVMTVAKNIGLDADTGADSIIISNVTMLTDLYIYNSASDDYIHFGPEDIEDMLRVLPSIHEGDFKLVTRFARDHYYAPVFSTPEHVCQKCGRSITYNPTTIELLFRNALESFKDIQ